MISYNIIILISLNLYFSLMEDMTMDAIECLITRRSIRRYKKEEVSPRDIENIVEISQMVSCWENTQPVQ